MIYKDGSENKNYSGSAVFIPTKATAPSLAYLDFNDTTLDLSGVTSSIIFDGNLYTNGIEAGKDILDLDSFRKKYFGQNFTITSFWNKPFDYLTARFVNSTPAYYHPCKALMVMFSQIIANYDIVWADFDTSAISFGNLISMSGGSYVTVEIYLLNFSLSTVVAETGRYNIYFNIFVRIRSSFLQSFYYNSNDASFQIRILKNPSPAIECVYEFNYGTGIWGPLPIQFKMDLPKPSDVELSKGYNNFVIIPPSNPSEAGLVCFNQIVDAIKDNQLFKDFDMMKWMYGIVKFL